MRDLALALILGLLVGLPQLLPSLRYAPRSLRWGRTAQEKAAWGSLPLWRIVVGMLTTRRRDHVAGVFYPEASCFVGRPALLCALLAPWSLWHLLLGLGILLAMGTRTPLFRWTSALHFRVPARYSYLVSVSLVGLAYAGFQRLDPTWQAGLLSLQMADLALGLPVLLPMHPYVQRWERPSRAFTSPLAQAVTQVRGRVSGLPYPLRTGHVTQTQTLGYNGGSQPQWMASFRGDTNPNGSGAHDWFALNEDGLQLDAYGVSYAYTYRPLCGKWRPTRIPHLYQNQRAAPAPTWKEVSRSIHARH